MKRILKNIVLLCSLAFAACAVSCSDPEDEILENNYSRLFSPTEFTAKVSNKTTVKFAWETVSKAESYTIEVFQDDPDLAFSGTPYKTYTGIKETTYTAVLEGETEYSARIKAVSDKISESKWTGVTFETDAEQILETISDDDIEAKQVTIRWDNTLNVTKVVTLNGEIEVESATRNLTAVEKAAGVATITGLTGETTYTIKIYNGEKRRGAVTVTTAVDLDGATPIYADETDILSIFANAEAGTTFCFLPAKDGTNSFYIEEPITLNKSCKITTILSKSVVTDIAFNIEGAVDVTLQNMTFDATAERDGAVVLKSPEASTKLTIENCTIKGAYTSLVYGPKASNDIIMESVTVDNCIIPFKGKTIYYGEKFVCKKTEVMNSTIYNSTADGCIRSDKTTSKERTFLVHDNTFFDMKNSSKGIFYIRSSAKTAVDFSCVIKNNIFGYTIEEGSTYMCNQSTTNGLFYSGNYYFNANILMTKPENSSYQYDSTGKNTEVNPFADAANANFTITDEFGIKVGDPRWYK